MRFRDWTLALMVGLAACGSGENGDPAGNGANRAEAADAAAENAAAEAATGETPPCPFRQTREWVGSVERGHVRINGYVDVTMAGFRPALTEREGAAAGTLALDLAFAPAPNEPINDHARFERTGAPSYRRAEIWCGGERIEAFDMIVVN
jgi:hypothetical protein